MVDKIIELEIKRRRHCDKYIFLLTAHKLLRASSYNFANTRNKNKLQIYVWEHFVKILVTESMI